MSGPIDRIDHVLIGVPDLVAAAADYARLGFALTPRGRHENWGTENACVMFSQDYIELLGVFDPARVTNGLDRFVADGPGLFGVAFGTDDAPAARDLLARLGYAATIQDLTRAVDTPAARPATLGFDLVRLDPGGTARAFPGVNGFVCHHRTPDLLRRPEWLVHPNGALRVVSVAVLVDDPVAAGDAYAALLGPGAVVPTDDMIAVHLDRHVLLYVDADDAASLYPDIDPPPERSGPIALSVAVADLAVTATLLKGAGVAFDRLADATVRVDPDFAAGVVLDFVAAR